MKWKNWKTTIAGLLGGSAQIVLLPINSWKDLIIPVTTMLLGLLAQDYDKKGL
jgi:hypothetical protein